MAGLTTARPGVAPAVIAVIVVFVVAAGGVAAYVFVFSPPGATATTSTTLTVGRSTVSGSSSTTQDLVHYVGSFRYVNPLGPSGVNDSSGKPVVWNSTQTAAGTFSFSINTATYIGSGSGSGNMTVTTRGYCTGSVTVPYKFNVTAGQPPGSNMIISFDVPAPGNVTVPLTCQGPTTGFYTANDPIAFLSVYPNGLSVASIPYTTTQPPTYGISYTVNIQTA